MDDGMTNASYEPAAQLSGTAISARPSDTLLDCHVSPGAAGAHSCVATFTVTTTAANQTFKLVNALTQPIYLGTYLSSGFAFGGRMTVMQVE
jgi:hypothetical protein